MTGIPPVGRSLVFATDALDPLRDLTAYAEGTGFDRVWTTDFPGRDAMTRALFLALRSTTIGIGTGITYAFTRSPHALAAAAADIQRLSGGRFILGLGTGTRGVRRWYEAEFDPPAPRLATLVDHLRREWAETKELDDVGPPAIAGAGLNEAMLRTVARVCDRVLLHPLGLVRDHLDGRALPAIAAGTARRTAGAPEIAAWCIASVDADREVARANARRQIAFYLATPSYGTVVEGTPWEPVAAKIRKRFKAMKKTDWHALGDLVPDGQVDEIAIAGTPAEARVLADRMERELAARGIGEIVMQTTGTGATAEELTVGARHILVALDLGAPWRARVHPSPTDAKGRS
jgi:alkanesulfonate monooxygenase SsuD/methylene tetrahydromethanopterin reductase-like flavin-dependent oxidoreductase (luciferase family)